MSFFITCIVGVYREYITDYVSSEPPTPAAAASTVLSIGGEHAYGDCRYYGQALVAS